MRRGEGGGGSKRGRGGDRGELHRRKRGKEQKGKEEKEISIKERMSCFVLFCLYTCWGTVDAMAVRLARTDSSDWMAAGRAEMEEDEEREEVVRRFAETFAEASMEERRSSSSSAAFALSVKFPICYVK